MGIRYLNSLLREKCRNAITNIHLSELSNKIIAIDISIYLYKYKSENALIENFYLMLSLFRQYQITPIFIFDGKPPDEKKQLITFRKKTREENKNAIVELKLVLQNVNDSEEIMNIENQIDCLSRKTTVITIKDIASVKLLIKGFGMCYYQAPREADEVCAYLMQNNRVYACLSDDSDMFLYGCERVLQNFNISKHTAFQYNFQQILKELCISKEEFASACIASGIDYQFSECDAKNINEVRDIFNNTAMLKTIEYSESYEKYFNIDAEEKNYLKLCDNIIISNSVSNNKGNILYDLMRHVLEEDGFIINV
jgi:flap endonuclease-1